ncbi:hypothetical protein GTY87_33890 [Streptomyces sp. SID7813]|uniref:Uncharacterized protein n=1 Tax=Streptomyces coelicolor (strain ATCC BAA-471 / A3(2) / M145) TaxID=100226 RepID=O86681_STRCO|nr:hypothetical protein [Streptomyces sp. SID7813]QFI46426.1 hypothetical protein FQ762_34230 [Streptomyces coelicolor A3(2)]CAA20545.1 hypothetical protein SC4G2.08 [Streptomyces coelicolor A3(2)]
MALYPRFDAIGRGIRRVTETYDLPFAVVTIRTCWTLPIGAMAAVARAVREAYGTGWGERVPM